MSETVADALTSHQYDDVIGAVEINVTDALLAIANSIQRLAVAQEKANQRDELFVKRVRDEVTFKAEDDDDGPGHA